MSDTTQTNAMAEIALALAMGFFSIMVLTMVSMGSSMVTQTQASSSIKGDPIQLAQSENSENRDREESAEKTQAVQQDDLVLFYKGRFWDHQLKEISAIDASAREKVVLAVSPDLSMSETMKARKDISNPNLKVVLLNDAWLNTLREAGL